jgi:uroporphyrinogen decarboxylase
MNRRELVQSTLNKRKQSDGCAFWLGHPSDEAKEIYCNALGIKKVELSELEKHNREASVLKASDADEREIELSLNVGSDMIWISPELDLTAWKHPEGKPMWDCFAKGRTSLGSAGIFAECTDVAEVEAFDWPNPDYLDFSIPVQRTKEAYNRGLSVFGGMWSPFFHVLCDFFGMENYFMKMLTDKAIVHAVTQHVVDFYIETNTRYLELVKDYIDAGFFGSDVGSQYSMMIDMDSFDEFLLPNIKRIIAPIKNAGLTVAYHSCGAVDSIIPQLIDAGIDLLHPLQALATGMDAVSLEKKYGKDLIFMGGVDTQQLLPFKSPKEVREEVLRLRDIFGDHFIVSPSHEALLANVPFENVVAMSKAAKE